MLFLHAGTNQKYAYTDSLVVSDSQLFCTYFREAFLEQNSLRKSPENSVKNKIESRLDFLAFLADFVILFGVRLGVPRENFRFFS